MQLKCEGCLRVNLYIKMKTGGESLVAVTLMAIITINHESTRPVQFPAITFLLSFALFVGLIDFEYLQFEVMLLLRAITTEKLKYRRLQRSSFFSAPSVHNICVYAPAKHSSRLDATIHPFSNF